MKTSDFKIKVNETIKELADDELKELRKGLYTLFQMLTRKGELKFEKFEELRCFFIELTSMAMEESLKRFEDEVPY